MSRVFSWKDRATWPSEWPQLECAPDDPHVKLLGQQMKHLYDYVRSYHGARPVDMQSYYETGLRPADDYELIRYAKSIYCGDASLGVSEDEVDIVARNLKYSNSGRLFLALDDRALIERAGHYLIYGSEYVMALGIELAGERADDVQRILKSAGIPTMFVLNTPTARMTDSDLSQLAWFIGTNQSTTTGPEIIDFTIELDCALPPECVLSHYHPTEVPDHHNHGIPYEWPDPEIHACSTPSHENRQDDAGMPEEISRDFCQRLGVPEHEFRLIIGRTVIDYDATKELENRKKHGYSLESAASLLQDILLPVGDRPKAISDAFVEHGEVRHMIMGLEDERKVVIFVTTMRPGEIVRVLSFRRASGPERARFAALTGFHEG